MKTLIRILVLIVPLLFLFNGCGGGGNSGSNSSTQTTNPNLKEVTVGINLPNSVSNKQTAKLQKTSTGSSIDSVTIDIFGQDDYSFSRNMEQSSTGKWTVTLLLDTTKVPFTFIVKAYDGDKKLYEGTIENVTVETLNREIIIPVNRVNGSTDRWYIY